MRETLTVGHRAPSGAKNSEIWEVSSAHIMTNVKGVVTLELTDCHGHDGRRDSHSPHQ